MHRSSYEYLARPYKLRPNTAAAMPEVSADCKTCTIRIRPGIYFADDPVFKGKKRELDRAGLRLLDQAALRPGQEPDPARSSSNDRIIGMDAIRKAALAAATFDYDREVEGLKRARPLHDAASLAEPNPRFAYH